MKNMSGESNPNYRHGGCGTKIYSSWKNLRQRCNDPNCPDYIDYGGRGITVCPEWDDFAVFRDWALANGYEEGLTIERKKVNLNYCPSNCTWIPMAEQVGNRRIQKSNTTGREGINPHVDGGFMVRRTVNKVRHYIGYFKTLELANEAMDKFEQEMGV